MGRWTGLGRAEKFRPFKAFSTSFSVQPLKSGLPHRPMGRAGFFQILVVGRAGPEIGWAGPGRAAGFGVSSNSELESGRFLLLVWNQKRRGARAGPGRPEEVGTDRPMG